MRKILALLLLIGFVTFPAVAGAGTAASEDVNAIVYYLKPLSLSVEKPAGTLYVGAASSTATGEKTIWLSTNGWNGSYASCERDIKNNGLTVFSLSGSPNQNVAISVNSDLELNGPDGAKISLNNMAICVSSDDGLQSGSTNCCASGNANVHIGSATISTGSSGSGYFAVRPGTIKISDYTKKGVFIGTITVTADYQ